MPVAAADPSALATVATATIAAVSSLVHARRRTVDSLLVLW